MPRPTRIVGVACDRASICWAFQTLSFLIVQLQVFSRSDGAVRRARCEGSNGLGADPSPTRLQVWRLSDGCERPGCESGDSAAGVDLEEVDQRGRAATQAGAAGVDPAQAGQRSDAASGCADAFGRGEARRRALRAIE